MRKTVFFFVLLWMMIKMIPFDNLAAEQDIRIFSSLAEVVPESDGAVLLVFFSIECHVCWEDLFEMRIFVESNRIPVILVGITKNKKEDLEPFLRKYSFFNPVISDRNRHLYRRFKVGLEPYKVILLGGQVMYADDYYENFLIRREKIKKCLSGIK